MVHGRVGDAERVPKESAIPRIGVAPARPIASTSEKISKAERCHARRCRMRAPRTRPELGRAAASSSASSRRQRRHERTHERRVAAAARAAAKQKYERERLRSSGSRPRQGRLGGLGRRANIVLDPAGGVRLSACSSNAYSERHRRASCGIRGDYIKIDEVQNQRRDVRASSA